MTKKLLLLPLAAVITCLSASAVSAQTYESRSRRPQCSSTHPGDPVRVTGSGCPPGQPVTVSVGGTTATATADANGNFSVQSTSPSVPGTYTVTSTSGTRVLSATLTVSARGAAPAHLPRTGSSNTTELSRIGLAVGAAGGVLVLVVRRRRIVALAG